MSTVVGVAWYTPSEWDQLREIAPDRDKLEATHAEWLALAERGLADLRTRGLKPYRVPVKIAELRSWCSITGRRPDAAARAEYASAELKRLHELGLLGPDA